MVLYTPLAYHDIFPEEDAAYMYVTYQNRPLTVRQTAQGTYELVRLLSTDPKDYLNDELLPGTILHNEFISQMK